MKIIVAGSTGFVATEVIRQSLSNPAVTSIVALGRRSTAVPQNAGPRADVSKLKPVVCDDFENYSESVKEELAEADACIWYTIIFAACPLSCLVTCNRMVAIASLLMYNRLLAVTPSKSKGMPFAEVRKICLDYTLTGIETIAQLPRDSASKPLRFIYTSGAKAQRDQSQKPWILGDLLLMRVGLYPIYLPVPIPRLRY